MSCLTFIAEQNISSVPQAWIQGKRPLTTQEKIRLKENGNTCDDIQWQHIYVSDEFDADLVHHCDFWGFVVIGALHHATLTYHDLCLNVGLSHSRIKNTVLGDDNAIHHVTYLDNYHTGSRVILFNIQEMSATHHAKFGNGLLKKGEEEKDRIWLAIANENGGRAVLPFEGMRTTDAFIWSCYKGDAALQQRFVQLTEYGQSLDCETFGIVEDDVVIKNTILLKDTKIGSCAYIKGASKLKNITVQSCAKAPSQIGEGVELVNGIMGYGSRVFYQAVAVRFVIGQNCQLKYGARLINSFLGDNATVSCCEVLNSLIFPFHEQHHNSSFLIASTIIGQSNIAAGATIGSNHNSRCSDGELLAKRGFWPGLCTNFKFNSRFASFVLISKGNYANELDIIYPFSLVSIGKKKVTSHLTIKPAWWFSHNMYAIIRNRFKFAKRDGRLKKDAFIETDPFAPDTMQEVLVAADRIVLLTAQNLETIAPKSVQKKPSLEKRWQLAKKFLLEYEENPEQPPLQIFDSQCQRKQGALVANPARGYKIYRQVLIYFAASALLEYSERHQTFLTTYAVSTLQKEPLFTNWVNAGGQIIPQERLQALCADIKEGKLSSWFQVHAAYDELQQHYTIWKARYALHILEWIYASMEGEILSTKMRQDFAKDAVQFSQQMYQLAYASRQKDFTDSYRCMMYQDPQEMQAVLGDVEQDEFLKELQKQTVLFNNKIQSLLSIH